MLTTLLKRAQSFSHTLKSSLNKYKPLSLFTTSLTNLQTLQPQSYNLQIHKSEKPAELIRKPDALLINQWWSQTRNDHFNWK